VPNSLPERKEDEERQLETFYTERNTDDCHAQKKSGDHPNEERLPAEENHP
jgi:hypothetical protein